MSSVINQHLIDCGILEDLRSNKNKYCNVKESKNLIAVYEQHIFIWHEAASCILTSELMTKKENKSKVLTLTNLPVFDVESILFNQTGSLLSLSGKNGIMIFEVPWRYWKFGSSGSDNENIVGRSWNIAESFFVCSNRVGVLQTAWHPGSTSSTHLTVLSTDNYIRIYDITDPHTPLQVIGLGNNTKSSYLTSESKINFSTCFGENPVSFDFGPPEEIHVSYLDKLKLVKKVEEMTVWPIYLLHSNGDVYCVKAPIKKEKFQMSSKVMGPLKMYPPSEDNYGYDACYILCLNTKPPCIVLATAAGVIYHCIILENTSNKKIELDTWDLSTDVDNFNDALYVFENVELPLTLTEEQDDVYSHPIKLYKDITSQNKYHCTHMSGLHSVAVPLLKSIEECLDSDKLEKLLTSELKQPSIVEHILCTKPFAEVDSVPVLGIDVMINDAGVTLICLLASWEFVCLPLITSYFSSVPQLLSENLSSSKYDSSTTSPMFQQHIEKILLRSVSCPYLKSYSTSEQTATSPQQWLDLLCNVTQRFREDYIQKLVTAQALLRSRIKLLTQQKEYQLKDIARSEQEKETLKIGAERLAEKYDDANAKQQKLLQRIEVVLHKFQQNLPHLSKAEINMKQTLLSYEGKLLDFDAALNLIKKKIKHQNDKLKETSEQVSGMKSDLDKINLNEVQTKRIKELLSKEGESISELMKNVNSLKKQVIV